MNSTTTATIDELGDAFKESLERKGVMGKLRASLRSELYKCLQSSVQHTRETNPSSSKEGVDLPLLASLPMKTGIPPENGIIDQLFIEYLEFNKYSYTLSTFQEELSGETQSEEAHDRDVSRKAFKTDLGVTQKQNCRYQYAGSSSLKVPLIYGIVKAANNDSDREGHNFVNK